MSEQVIDVEQVIDAEQVIEVANLSKTFRVGLLGRKVQAVRDVSFGVSRGQVLGYLGPNGSGKTTSIKCMLGLIQPTAGKISLFGRRHDDPLARARIGYMPEHPYFYDYLKPTEVLDYVGRLYGIPRKVRQQRIPMLLDRLGVAHAMDRTLRGFSKGMLQRVGIAQSLMSDPDLLVLDEPMSGLDPFGRKQIRDLLIELRAEGKTLFVTSHVLSDIEHLCDTVVILRDGQAIAQGALAELLLPDKRESAATLLLPEQDREQAAQALLAIPGTTQRKRKDDVLVIAFATGAVNDITAAASRVGAQLIDLHPQRDSLEELFLREALSTTDAPSATGAA